jgi:hypothetical protein
LVTGKSKRQLNDWVRERKNKKCVKRLKAKLTNLLDLKGYRIVINTLRKWCDDLSPGDMLAFNCTSAMPEKQYRVWCKWLKNKEVQYLWKENPELRCFTFYKQRCVE